MEPLCSPSPKGCNFFIFIFFIFLELSIFLFCLFWAGLDVLFGFCGATQGLAVIPQGASVFRDQICGIWPLSKDLGGQRLRCLGREGVLQYPDVGAG